MAGKIRMGVKDCQLITLDRHPHRNGNLSVIENGNGINFDPKRVYYLYDVPGGATRGGHAHRELYQLLVAATGSFDVHLYDGEQRLTVTLNRPYQALLIVPGVWRELDNFASGSICLVTASALYDELEYIRDFDQFLKYSHE